MCKCSDFFRDVRRTNTKLSSKHVLCVTSVRLVVAIVVYFNLFTISESKRRECICVCLPLQWCCCLLCIQMHGCLRNMFYGLQFELSFNLCRRCGCCCYCVGCGLGYRRAVRIHTLVCYHRYKMWVHLCSVSLLWQRQAETVYRYISVLVWFNQNKFLVLNETYARADVFDIRLRKKNVVLKYFFKCIFFFVYA